MSDVRPISWNKIDSFETKSGQKVNMEPYKHMLVGDAAMDLDLAKDGNERGWAERFCVSPERTSRGQRNQLLKLDDAFEEVQKLTPGEYALLGGEILHKSKVKDIIITDLDARITDIVPIIGEFHTGITLKYNNGEGGSQNGSFVEMLQLIREAPSITSGSKTALCIYVGGDYWFDSKSTFKNAESRYQFNNRFSLLKELAKAHEKRCVIISDDDLPQDRSSFYETFIKGKF